MGLNKTYLGFDDIPVNNFYKIAETGDLRWFYKSFYEDRGLKMSESETLNLAERYKSIYDDRIKYTNDVKSTEYYRKLNEVSDLKAKLFRISCAFDVIIDLEPKSEIFLKYVEYFKDYEFFTYTKRLKFNKDFLDYINWLRLKVKGFKTKVAITESNYSDILKPNLTESQNNKFDIVKEKVLLQESLSIAINIYTCPLIEWCAMVLRAEEKSIESKKQLDKIKNKK
ncbi:hypothetical protein [uncultured Winogradskyella sp.]|uniref:hypothetical protein n=1 Tax=uncultured Winogradskyella sp. TaxID=395353 RepID=UPI0030ED4215|tara:strand:+ start:2436 stop:3113 length:678 start_codon:yes stop_codon:yes gene_type:complete